MKRCKNCNHLEIDHLTDSEGDIIDGYPAVECQLCSCTNFEPEEE